MCQREDVFHIQLPIVRGEVVQCAEVHKKIECSRNVAQVSEVVLNEYGLELPKAPSEYYKEQVYVDTISYHLPAMRCCLDWLGPDHIMLGTDYAHPIGHIEQAVHDVTDMCLSEEDTGKILGENAARIFKLE